MDVDTWSLFINIIDGIWDTRNTTNVKQENLQVIEVIHKTHKNYNNYLANKNPTTGPTTKNIDINKKIRSQDIHNNNNMEDTKFKVLKKLTKKEATNSDQESSIKPNNRKLEHQDK